MPQPELIFYLHLMAKSFNLISADISSSWESFSFKNPIVLLKSGNSNALLYWLHSVDFLDSSGGGGWGPVVSTTLMAGGNHPTKIIGTVNATEFFVAFASGSVFTIFVGIESIEIVVGLIIGGMLAAPFGALLANKINKRYAMVLVGILIIFLSSRIILKSFGIF